MPADMLVVTGGHQLFRWLRHTLLLNAVPRHCVAPLSARSYRASCHLSVQLMRRTRQSRWRCFSERSEFLTFIGLLPAPLRLW